MTIQERIDNLRALKSIASDPSTPLDVLHAIKYGIIASEAVLKSEARHGDLAAQAFLAEPSPDASR